MTARSCLGSYDLMAG